MNAQRPAARRYPWRRWRVRTYDAAWQARWAACLANQGAMRWAVRTATGALTLHPDAGRARADATRSQAVYDDLAAAGGPLVWHRHRLTAHAADTLSLTRPVLLHRDCDGGGWHDGAGCAP